MASSRFAAGSDAMAKKRPVGVDLIKRALKEEILKPRYHDSWESLGPAVNSVLLEHGLAAQLCTSLEEQALQEHRQAMAQSAAGGKSTARASDSPLPLPESSTAGEDDLSVVASLVAKWTAQLHHSLMSHCEETGMPLLRVGDAGRQTGSARSRGVKCLYTMDDIVALLESVQHPNHAAGRTGARSWCLTPLELATPRVPQLRHMFAELAPTERQNGLDDELRGWFADERYAIGTRLLATGYAPHLRQFARNGVPAGLRAKVWLGALRLGAVSERDYNYYASLQREVSRVTLATDELVKRDAAQPSREEDYFVFGEMIEEVLLAFCRDPLVSPKSSHPKPPPIIARNRQGQKAAFPPSGVPPGRGLADFVCPLCFVYSQPTAIYTVFRELWARHWCKLHAFSSTPGSLLPLLRLFEDLLQETAPAVCFHLLRLELYPARIALGWIASGFAAFLPAEQTLILWDRIIGFDSLELLPVLAAAVFVYRARWLLQASEPAHVHRLLHDATGLQVVPLLQLFLTDHNQLVALEGEVGGF